MRIKFVVNIDWIIQQKFASKCTMPYLKSKIELVSTKIRIVRN